MVIILYNALLLQIQDSSWFKFRKENSKATNSEDFYFKLPWQKEYQLACFAKAGKRDVGSGIFLRGD